MPKDRLYNILSILCGLWFLAFGMFWVYWINLVLAYPVGVLGLYFWKKANDIQGGALNRAALMLLATGLLASLGVLLFYR